MSIFLNRGCVVRLYRLHRYYRVRVYYSLLAAVPRTDASLLEQETKRDRRGVGAVDNGDDDRDDSA